MEYASMTNNVSISERSVLYDLLADTGNELHVWDHRLGKEGGRQTQDAG